MGAFLFRFVFLGGGGGGGNMQPDHLSEFLHQSVFDIG